MKLFLFLGPAEIYNRFLCNWVMVRFALRRRLMRRALIFFSFFLFCIRLSWIRVSSFKFCVNHKTPHRPHKIFPFSPHSQPSLLLLKRNTTPFFWHTQKCFIPLPQKPLEKKNRKKNERKEIKIPAFNWWHLSYLRLLPCWLIKIKKSPRRTRGKGRRDSDKNNGINEYKRKMEKRGHTQGILGRI